MIGLRDFSFWGVGFFMGVAVVTTSDDFCPITVSAQIEAEATARAKLLGAPARPADCERAGMGWVSTGADGGRVVVRCIDSPLPFPDVSPDRRFF